jgi:excisionase family DNA binding protein
VFFMEKGTKRRAQGARQTFTAPPTPEIVGGFKLKPAAAYLGGLSVPTMHRLIARGLLRPNRSLRHLLFPKSELDRFLREGMAE